MSGRLGSEVRQSLTLLALTATATACLVGIGLLAARLLG
jgi:hypothetical protein